MLNFSCVTVPCQRYCVWLTKLQIMTIQMLTISQLTTVTQSLQRLYFLLFFFVNAR